MTADTMTIEMISGVMTTGTILDMTTIEMTSGTMTTGTISGTIFAAKRKSSSAIANLFLRTRQRPERCLFSVSSRNTVPGWATTAAT
jgi:hypothetical protein